MATVSSASAHCLELCTSPAGQKQNTIHSPCRLHCNTLLSRNDRKSKPFGNTEYFTWNCTVQVNLLLNPPSPSLFLFSLIFRLMPEPIKDHIGCLWE